MSDISTSRRGFLGAAAGVAGSLLRPFAARGQTQTPAPTAAPAPAVATPTPVPADPVASALAKLAREKQRLFALTHTYSGYPMVRHARELVESGEIGEVRVVQPGPGEGPPFGPQPVSLGAGMK